jgi:hypothetical protein
MHDKAPDYINRVAGVRVWRVAPNLWANLGGILWAPNVKEPWPNGEEYEARCEGDPDHKPPAEKCMCGVYGFYNPNLAIAATMSGEGEYWPVPWQRHYSRLVAGVIGGGGDIELCEYGFRSELARVEAIFTDGAPDEDFPCPWRTIDESLPLARPMIAEIYGIPLISASDYEDFCAEAGLMVIDPSTL